MKKIESFQQTYSIPEVKSDLLEIQDSHSWLIFVSEYELKQTNLTELLKKIVIALNLVWDQDVKIISFNPDSYFKFNQLSRNSLKCIVGFGIDPAQFGLQGFEIKHQVYSIYNKSILFGDLLVSYTNDASKKLLWKALQEANKSW